MRSLASTALIATIFWSPFVHAADARVKNNHLHFQGKNYFRVGAATVTQGAYGEKKSPIFQGNYLEVQATLPAPKLDGKVKQAAIVDIDWDKSSSVGADLQGSVPSVVNTGAKVKVSDLKSGKLKLVYLYILPNDIKTATNNSPKALDNLRSYGADARIAHEIFVVMEAETARQITTSGSLSVGLAPGGGLLLTGGLLPVQGKLVGGGATTSRVQVTLSPGTTYAYLLVKLKWTAGKKSIEKCTDDQWGPV